MFISNVCANTQEGAVGGQRFCNYDKVSRIARDSGMKVWNKLKGKINYQGQ